MGIITIPAEAIPRELNLKVAGPCNLACDYCYMYKLADTAWLRMPRVMPRKVMLATARRQGAYMAEHNLGFMRNILHGGEPLLAGVDELRYLLEVLTTYIPQGATLEFNIQTNGTMLNREVLDLFRQYSVTVGVSLDGTQADNDRHRLYENGRSTHAATVRGINLLRTEYPELFNGVLSVVDPRNDPIKTFEYLLQLQPPTIRFILPLGNWQTPPPGYDPRSKETPYADWLLTIFNKWYAMKAPQPIVEPFASLARLHLMRDGTYDWRQGVENFGPWVPGALVIDTDGSYAHSDALKSVADGADRTGLNVFEHHMTAALVQKLRRAQQLNLTEITAPKCVTCPVVEICGGGLHTDRFNGQHYNNPSVFCKDLFLLTGGVAISVNKTLTERLERYKQHHP